MRPTRLFSSDEIIQALLRGGFEIARKPKGSHQALTRLRTDGGHDVTIVPLAEKQIPRGTLDSILRLANVEYEQFLVWAKVKRRPAR